MIESKFKVRVIFSFAIVVLALLLIAVFEANQYLTPYSDTPLFFVIFFSLFFIYFLMYLIFGELRQKAIKVSIGKTSISSRGFIGMGLKKEYEFTDIEGYRISFIASRTGSYEYLYLIFNNKKIIKLSEFYHRNYNELKTAIIQHQIKNLGVEYWSFLQETKDIFY